MLNFLFSIWWWSLPFQLVMIFTDECDKFKDLTHVHSFAHDFHLRTMQLYLSGQPLAVFKQNYHITAFLKDFVAHYPYTPSFSRNYINEGTSDFSQTLWFFCLGVSLSVNCPFSSCWIQLLQFSFLLLLLYYYLWEWHSLVQSYFRGTSRPLRLWWRLYYR